MSPSISRRVAEWIDFTNSRVKLTWHCGEPLVTPIEQFEELIQPFSRLVSKRQVTHIIQTNATLLDIRWGKLLKAAGFEVSVSIDGPRNHNLRRLNKSGGEIFQKIIAGIEVLRECEIPYSALAVVNISNEFDVTEFFEFFADIGCRTLGINIEETVGVNRSSLQSEELVKSFWSELFELWAKSPSFRIREFDHVLRWSASQGTQDALIIGKRPLELIPSISFNGDVVVLSPELMQMNGSAGRSFVIGNLQHELLESILARARRSWYVQDYITGRKNCLANCEYFDACGGGSAASKFFENGDFASTTTAHCRNSEQLLIDAVIEKL